jgi:hypothetical protein
MFQESPSANPVPQVKQGRFHELAEAIRRGCQIAPKQTFGYYTSAPDGACALGAAALATGYQKFGPTVINDHLREVFPGIWDLRFGHFYLFELIAHENDSGMTREAIANHLDMLE